MKSIFVVPISVISNSILCKRFRINYNLVIPSSQVAFIFTLLRTIISKPVKSLKTNPECTSFVATKPDAFLTNCTILHHRDDNMHTSLQRRTARDTWHMSNYLVASQRLKLTFRTPDSSRIKLYGPKQLNTKFKTAHHSFVLSFYWLHVFNSK